ncbi:zinc finger protein 385B isoform X2 [Paramormyrops kingsleyae]|uniref:Zinc finger protein 385B n=1 Tax=Paramormyrops kingsleyae TaxID=1676925 RepID=A0A3B3QEC8_9TELE|nr:zinc finger protein 385B isoform X2 [Paramormyrops kingsleyae]
MSMRGRVWGLTRTQHIIVKHCNKVWLHAVRLATGERGARTTSLAINDSTIAEGMKRPLSPTRLLENGRLCLPFGTCLDLEEAGDGAAELRLTQEKKKLLFSLCEVCNIQLNSAAQAQVHYNGKSHLKRVKQLNNGELPPAGSPANPITSSSSSGSSCHSNTLPALVRTPPLMMQSTLDMKPFMSFSVDTSSPAGLFPNFNTMDPVQKAVINHTFGVSIPPKKKQVISCSICQLRFNSDSQAEAHYKGSKHAKKLKAQESTKNKQKNAPSRDKAKTITITAAGTANNPDQPENNEATPTVPKAATLPKPFAPTAGAAPVLSLCKPAPEPLAALPPAETPAQTPAPTDESEEEKAKKLLYCSLCKVAVNSLSQLEAHNSGSKHKTMLEARNGAGPIKAYPRPGSKLKVQAAVTKGSGLQNKTFHCEICDVHVNSEIQLKQHISSRRHKDRVAGKPIKPKYSPYNKQQRSTNALAAKLAFQKDLVKPLSPAFISAPFSATTVPSISLHPRPNTSLFQTAALPASFLRAAPGPIRPAAGSILFAPY